MKTIADEPVNPALIKETRVTTERNAQIHRTEVMDYPGLTKREYFVAEAMKGLLSSVDWNTSIAGLQHADATAQFAIMYADSVITELNK